MFALRSGLSRNRARRRGPAAHEMRDEPPLGKKAKGLVLPRVLRRPVRWMSRAISGETDVPRFSTSILTAAFLGSAVLYGVMAGGHLSAVVQAASSRAGFAIDKVDISGHRETSEIDILGTLELTGWTSLIGFSAEAARGRIASLPWIESVSVRKSYPSTLEIKIVERKPFAIWQSGTHLSLIEQSGKVIVSYPGRKFATLPLVIGLGAPENASEIVALAAQQPEIATRIKAYIRVANRRWDLRLENGVTVKLPDRGEAQALADLASLDRSHRLLSRDILAVDMRLADRYVVKLTPEAAIRRAASLKDNAKRRSEANI